MSGHCVGPLAIQHLPVWSAVCVTCANGAKFSNGRLMLWAMFLQSCYFRVEAVKESDNEGAALTSFVKSFSDYFTICFVRKEIFPNFHLREGVI